MYSKTGRTINTNKIHQFDEHFRYLKENFSPAFNSKGSKIAFATYKNYKYKDLVVYDLKKDTSYTLCNDIMNLQNIKWSDNDKYVIFNCKISRNTLNPELAIGIIDTYSKELIYLSDKNRRYDVGMIKNDTILYSSSKIGDQVKDSNFSCIHKYVIKTKKSDVLYCCDYPYFIRTPVYYKSNIIYFIKIEAQEEAVNKSDIWKLNLETDEIIKITSDGHIKCCLNILE